MSFNKSGSSECNVTWSWTEHALNDRDTPRGESGLLRSRDRRLISSFWPGTAPRIERPGALSYWKGPAAAPIVDAEEGTLADASKISPVWVFSLGPKRLTGSNQWPDVAFRIWNCRLPGDGLYLNSAFSPITTSAQFSTG